MRCSCSVGTSSLNALVTFFPSSLDFLGTRGTSVQLIIQYTNLIFIVFMWYNVLVNRFWQIDGKRLRSLRKERLFTQVELSKMTGVAQDSISSLETGKREAHPGTIKKLAEALGEEPRKLLKEQE